MSVTQTSYVLHSAMGQLEGRLSHFPEGAGFSSSSHDKGTDAHGMQLGCVSWAGQPDMVPCPAPRLCPAGSSTSHAALPGPGRTLGTLYGGCAPLAALSMCG